MKKSFASKRVARKITRDDEDDDGSPSFTASGSAQDTSPVVRRPNIVSKPKRTTSSRLAFSLTSSQIDDDSEIATTLKKKAGLSRQALERNAERFATPTAGDETPSYSKDYLNELRNSTPSTPGSSNAEVVPVGQAIDVASKFGQHGLQPNSIIPTDAEIQEKKARRARAAKEGGYISLKNRETASEADSDSQTEDEFGNLVLRRKDRSPETRLERDDEDFAEGFDEFTGADHSVPLGRRGEKEAARRRKQEMAEMIQHAEGTDENETADDSEGERNRAYEAAQTKAGTYADSAIEKNRRERAQDEEKWRIPPKITPLPDLRKALERFRQQRASAKDGHAQLLHQLSELQKQRRETKEQETFIQQQLSAKGAEFERLKEEAGAAYSGNIGASNDSAFERERGLESLGGTPVPSTPSI